MKRVFIVSAIAAGMCLCTACPPQNTPGHSATLTWRPGGIYAPSVQYRIYRGATPSDLVLGSTVPKITTTVTDTAVVSGQTYCYVVAAYDTATGLESRTAAQCKVIP